MSSLQSYKQVEWSRLRRFQERARIVMSTPIARRADLATLGTTMQIISRVGEPINTFVREHPPIEEIEAAAARLRPIFLEGDGIHYNQVTKALGSLTQEAALPTKQCVAACRKAWQTLNTNNTWSIQAGTESDMTGPTWDRQIARDWLYGDLVHADADAQYRIRHIPERERIMAALLWVKDGVLLTRATYQLISDLEDLGELR